MIRIEFSTIRVAKIGFDTFSQKQILSLENFYYY
jgi:hypothetical protein